MTLTKFYKNPLSTLDYTVDWTDFLDGGDTITVSEWIMPSADITLVSSGFAGPLCTAWVTGGKTGIEYDLVNHITTLFGRDDYRIISIYVIAEPNELSDLMSELRIHLGDNNLTTYRYLDEWLMTALESSVMALQRWWGDKYIFDLTGDNIIRNPTYTNWVMTSPPEIQERDRRPIVLMASILIKSGQLENNSWGLGSWRDAEIAVSNIEGGKAKQFSISLDWEELKMYILPPTKKLAGSLRIPHPSTEE
jgi:hypothetical protein